MPIKPAKSPQKHTRSKQKTEPSSPVLAQHGSYLLQLPSELLTHLTAYLSPVALTTLASVCRLLYDHINQDNTWRCAFLCHFLGISPNPDFPNEHPRLVLLRRSEGSWRTEFQKHWVIAKRWERTRNATSVTHRPHRTPITATHIMQSPKNSLGAQHNWAILSASLAVGTVMRSYPFTGKVVRGHFDASSTTTALGLGLNPNFQEALSNVSALALASSGGTGLVVWGLRSGGVAVTVALRAMEAGCNARMVKCSLGDAHRTCVEDAYVENGVNGNECFVTGAADGSVKLWNLPTNQRGQLSCIWTGEYTDGGSLVSDVAAFVKVPCVKVTIDVLSEVVVAGYADGTVLVWFGVTPGSLDLSSIKCVRIPPPPLLPLPLSTLRIHGHSRVSVSILAHHSTDAHFYRLRVERGAGLLQRLRFGGGPLGALSAITSELVQQEKEDVRTTPNSTGTSTLSSLVGTPTILTSAPPTPVPNSPPRSSVQANAPLQLQLPKPELGSAPRPRSFVAAGDALGRVCVWDWDADEEVVRKGIKAAGASDDDASDAVSVHAKFVNSKNVPEVQAAVTWDALDGEGISALAWGDVVVAVGSVQGDTLIFDSLTHQLLRRIPAPSLASANHEREAVSQLTVKGDTILITVGSQVIAWHVRKDNGKGANGWGKSPSKGKRNASVQGGGAAVAKWQQRNELNTEISHSLNQMKDEHARAQPALRRARAQAGALAEMGLDEADAIQYLMMLSRDEEDARQTGESSNDALLHVIETGSPDHKEEVLHGSPTNSTRSTVPSASTSPSSKRSGRSVYIPASRGPRINVDDIPDDNPYLGGGSLSPYRTSSSHGGSSRYGESHNEIDEDEELRLVLELSLVEQ